MNSVLRVSGSAPYGEGKVRQGRRADSSPLSNYWTPLSNNWTHRHGMCFCKGLIVCVLPVWHGFGIGVNGNLDGTQMTQIKRDDHRFIL